MLKGFTKTYAARPMNLFFAELIISLLFFSISGAVILKVFAEADSKARKSAQLESAVLCAQSVAEAYSVCGSVQQAFELVFGEDCAVDGVLRLDGDCRLCEDGEILLTFLREQSETAAGTLSQLTLTFTMNDEELYTLDCSAYIPKGGNADEQT